MDPLDWFLEVVKHENERVQKANKEDDPNFEEIHRDFQRASENFYDQLKEQSC